ncbi:SxtJ family membrane protein [Sphingobium aromaticiconvertens]|uniref:SxtJ family membrane protein n=1 Tax=Sphingobium aromaticiconvertens TaxID=365341 RepID=UPI003018883E
MSQGAHESFVDRSVIALPSNRRFGIIIGAILMAFGCVRWLLGWSQELNLILFVAGGALLILGLLAPAVLAPLNYGWMKIGLILGAIINPLVMLIMFLVAFLPIALIMRAVRRDALQLNPRKKTESYWNERSAQSDGAGGLTDQF